MRNKPEEGMQTPTKPRAGLKTEPGTPAAAAAAPLPSQPLSNPPAVGEVGQPATGVITVVCSFMSTTGQITVCLLFLLISNPQFAVGH